MCHILQCCVHTTIVESCHMDEQAYHHIPGVINGDREPSFLAVQLLDRRNAHREQKSPASHLALNGGKLNVRREHMPLFLETYAYDLCVGIAPCVVELLPHRQTGAVGFNLFYDFDLISNTPNQLRTCVLVAFARHIQCAIRSLYQLNAKAAALLTVVICGNSPTPTKKYENAHKHGYHFHLPGFVVDCVRALYIREMMLKQLRDDPASVDDGGNVVYVESFEEMIDASMFTQSYGGSLRMVGSDKVVNTQKRHEGCSYPATQRKYVAAGRTYRPLLVVDHAGVCQPEALDAIYGVQGGGVSKGNMAKMRRLMYATSLWTDQPLTGTLKLCPQHPVPVVQTGARANRTGQIAVEHMTAENTKEHGHVLKAVQTAYGSVYQHIRLGPLQHYEKFIMVKSKKGSEGATSCHNLISGQHASSTIWFMLYPNGVLAQRCYCKKTTTQNRRLVSCPDFNRGDPSRKVTGGHVTSSRLSPKILAHLFGNSPPNKPAATAPAQSHKRLSSSRPSTPPLCSTKKPKRG